MAAIISVPTPVTVKKILVGLDFSPASEPLIKIAAGIARHFGAELLLNHSMAVLPTTIGGMSGPGDYFELSKSYAEKELERIARSADLDDVNKTCLIGAGSPALGILDYAMDNDVDLIIMGTHGRRGIPHLLMASVTEEVLRKAKCPVLTVGPGLSKRFLTGTKVEKILYPTDLSERSLHAMPLVASIGVEQEAQIHCLHVAAPSTTEEETEPIRTRLQSLLCKHLSARYRAYCSLDYGDVADRIVANARIEESDLIVLGVGTRGLIDRHYEHITYKVIAESPCPVLTWIRE